MVDADLAALGLTSPNGDANTHQVLDNASVRQGMALTVD